MFKKRTIPLVTAIALTLAATTTTTQAQAVFAFGPIEKVTPQSVTVLGQVFLLRRGAVQSISFATGDLVLLEGDLNSAGQIVVRSFRLSKTPFVLGASDVALSGAVKSFNASTGTLQIGDLSVHATDALASGQLKIAVGANVSILGRQFLPLGAIWATEIHLSSPTTLPSFSTQAIEGTGRSTVGVQAIEGTGTSTQSIEGTGRSLRATQGLSISSQAIEGTGVSTSAIEGTGTPSY